MAVDDRQGGQSERGPSGLDPDSRLYVPAGLQPGQLQPILCSPRRNSERRRPLPSRRTRLAQFDSSMEGLPAPPPLGTTRRLTRHQVMRNSSFPGTDGLLRRKAASLLGDVLTASRHAAELIPKVRALSCNETAVLAAAPSAGMSIFDRGPIRAVFACPARTLHR